MVRGWIGSGGRARRGEEVEGEEVEGEEVEGEEVEGEEVEGEEGEGEEGEGEEWREWGSGRYIEIWDACTGYPGSVLPGEVVSAAFSWLTQYVW